MVIYCRVWAFVFDNSPDREVLRGLHLNFLDEFVGFICLMKNEIDIVITFIANEVYDLFCLFEEVKARTDCST